MGLERGLQVELAEHAGYVTAIRLLRCTHVAGPHVPEEHTAGRAPRVRLAAGGCSARLSECTQIPSKKPCVSHPSCQYHASQTPSNGVKGSS
jgi:hypothetical protein